MGTITADDEDALNIAPGEPLLIRETIQHSRGLRRAHRLCMPFTIAEHTPWADDPHLPPTTHVHEHFTHHGHTLTWTEHIRARMPIGDEHQTLTIPPGTPLLIALRLTNSKQDNGPLILEETRQRADQIGLAYHLH